ncbi:diguanylate cyclase [candidate division WOR-3 bacterium]|nr:diguanylate cyclase [candidate division WOR-3 bacterium]
MNSSAQVKWLWTLLTLILVASLVSLELFTNPEISIALLYLIPVAISAWFVGKAFSIAVSAFIVAMWTFAEIYKGKVYSSVSLHYYYAAVRLFFFVVVTTLLARLKTALSTERVMSRLDFLTDVMNSRSFYELAAVELERCRRYGRVFSVAYMDMDNLKAINDKFGHSKGDDVLRAIASTIKENLRKNDLVARMGGDEFVILFPETEYKAADKAVKKIQDTLKRKKSLEEFSISFSIGILTCESCPDSIDEMIELVDSLMYSIKNHKKDGIAHSIYKQKAKSL